MKAIRSIKDLELIRKENLLVYHLPEGKSLKCKLRGAPLEYFVKEMGTDEVSKEMVRGHFYYNDDLTGRRTLIMKEFQTDKEMMDWLPNLDAKAMEKEMKERYGPCSGFLDSAKRQFLVTLRE